MTRLWKLPVAAVALWALAGQPAVPGLEQARDALTALRDAGQHAVSQPAQQGPYRAGGHFRALSDYGRPVAWGHCGGTVAINTASLRPADRPVVLKAARDFTRPLTGRWRVVSTTARTGTGSTIVLSADHRDDGSGAYAHTTTTLMPRGGRSEILDATTRLAPLVAGRGPVLRHVVLHELAHAVGAGHSDDPADITFTYVGDPHGSYTASEAAGLARVTARGCG